MPRAATLRRQRVKCGKPNCRKWHGPYWYAFWWQGDRTRSAYVGSDARLQAFLRARDGEVGGHESNEDLELRAAHRQALEQFRGGASTYRLKSGRKRGSGPAPRRKRP